MPDDSSKTDATPTTTAPEPAPNSNERVDRGPQRAPGLSRADIDAVLKKQPGVQRVVKIVEPIEAVEASTKEEEEKMVSDEKKEETEGKELIKVEDKAEKKEEAKGDEEKNFPAFNVPRPV